MLLDGGDCRDKALSVEAVEIQLVGWLVGSSNHHHACLEQHLEKPAENDCISNVIDEQLIETQHADFFGQ
ncbi:hypothetical protein D3C77_712130 [compost metagenome]